MRGRNHLKFASQSKPVQILARGDADLLPAAARLTRFARGHPEGYIEAFANLYLDAAEAIAGRLTGQAADPLALDFSNCHQWRRLAGLRGGSRIITRR